MSRRPSSIAVIWRIARPYFVSDDRVAGRILLAVVIVLELGLTTVNVMLNHWNARFYNALQDRNWDAFVNELMIFCIWVAAYPGGRHLPALFPCSGCRSAGAPG